MAQSALVAIVIACLLCLFCSTYADLYMQNPRGSNDRNREQNTNRNNANRLFNSQNNAKGGYPWAGNPTLQASPDPLMFYAKSKLRLEWTVQHGCGANGNSECDFIIQYLAVDDTSDLVRDGYPTGPLKTRAAGYQYATFTDTSQNADGTNEIPLPPSFPGASGNQFNANDAAFGTGVSADVVASNFETFCNGGLAGTHKGIEFGTHESCASYRRCTTTSRNKGLYTADRNLGGDSARFTRQNNNGNRHGLECPEERDYYPYWRPSEWRDVAVLTSNSSWCSYVQQESQNIKSKFYCQMPTGSTELAPISKTGCEKAQGTWTEIAAWGLPPPDCVFHPTSRDNHLGNTAVDTFGGHSQPKSAYYEWTIPDSLKGKRVVLRYRYNMSASTYESHADFMPTPGKATDASLNCQAGKTGSNGGAQCGNDLMRDGPVGLYNNPYVKLWTDPDGNDVHLALAINTAQVGRTFQDRSFVFHVRSDAPNCAGQVINLNIRGKRGNIVQTYPATEYDFVPSMVEMGTEDCIDFQWAGSDFNAANQDGEGADQTDRHNLVEVRSANLDPNSPDYFHLIPQAGPRVTMFSQTDAKMLAYSSQTLSACAALTADDNNNDERADNCAKLNAAPNVYRHPGLLSFAAGSFAAISTRNNNFSNRQQKFRLLVSSSVSTGIYIAVAVVSAIAIAVVAACCVARRRPKSNFGRAINAIFMGRRAFRDAYMDVGASEIPHTVPGEAIRPQP